METVSLPPGSVTVTTTVLMVAMKWIVVSICTSVADSIDNDQKLKVFHEMAKSKAKKHQTNGEELS